MARRPVARVASRLDELVEAFLLSKKVAGCTDWTITIYGGWLHRFAQTENANALDSVAVTRFFAGLRSRNLSANTIHQAYRTLKTFLRWCYDTGTMQHDPVRGFRVRLPRTLPTVPTDEEVQRVLACCRGGRVGKRNRALILIMADAGLRAAEVMHLLVEDWHPMERSLFVRSGKGRKDRTVFVNPVTSRAIREYLSSRRLLALDEFLFVNDGGEPLKGRHLIQICHRLSARASLPAHRRLHPHALRHYAATSWLRNGMGLDEVRRLLGHESLNTTLRYSSLVASDLQRAHKKAAAIERLRLR